MAYALANITNVTEQVVSVLNANPGVWSDTVSGEVGAYPSIDELNLAILQGDEQVCTEGYFQSVNDSLSNPFAVTSAPLADQDQVPFHHGALNKVEVSKSVLSLTQAAISTSTDIITYADHGLVTGDIASWVLVSGSLPTCGSPTFAILTNYYVIKVTANTIKLARTLAEAIAGSAIDILTAPTGIYLLIGWQIGIEAISLDDVTNATAVGADYVGAGAFDFLYRPQDGQIYTPAQFARVTYPEYIRTSSLQARQSEEFLVTCCAIRKLMKNATPAPITYYAEESARGLDQLKQDGIYTQSPEAGEGDNR
jgi:hypothetical protein